MEAMSYVNIFETKGLEYLLVISFLIGFVVFVRHLTYARIDTGPVEEAINPIPEAPILCPAGADCPYDRQAMLRDEEEDDRKSVVA